MPRKKVDAGELTAPESVVEEPVVEEPKKRGRKPKVVSPITESEFLEALTALGGTAKLGGMYKKISETNVPTIVVPRFKTAIRVQGIKLAAAGKIEALHVDGKRSYTFKLV